MSYWQHHARFAGFLRDLVDALTGASRLGAIFVAALEPVSRLEPLTRATGYHRCTSSTTIANRFSAHPSPPVDAHGVVMADVIYGAMTDETRSSAPGYFFMHSISPALLRIMGYRLMFITSPISVLPLTVPGRAVVSYAVALALSPAVFAVDRAIALCY